jgi:hypothetical protein
VGRDIGLGENFCSSHKFISASYHLEENSLKKVVEAREGKRLDKEISFTIMLLSGD